MYGFVIFQKPVYDDFANSDVWSRNTNAIALAFSKFGFTLGLMLFSLPIIMNKAKTINSILGARILEVISKISYSGYLVHYLIVTYINASQYNTTVEGLQFFKLYITVYVLTIILSTIVYTTVEVPFQNIEKLLFEK